MTPHRHGSAVIDFPSDLEIRLTREFDAPIQLVFDVLTKPEHVTKWFAPFTCVVTECSIDLRVQTWLFEGWPDAPAVESVDLHEADGVTTLTMTTTFRDQAGRARMDKSDGQEDSFDKMEDLLRSLVRAE